MAQLPTAKAVIEILESKGAAFLPLFPRKYRMAMSEAGISDCYEELPTILNVLAQRQHS
ncbi:MAG: hypothetical protein JST36_06200 [Bacteroidetes bacterium]|nr:hypothetical protein [Bacteroidota bacterium]